MAYRDLVRNWHKGILALEEGDWALALKIFQSIEMSSSKIEFNIGCIHLLRGELAEALEAFDQTVSKDNCLAVGFYQRGYVCLRLERYEEALNDCQLALAHLRNNSFIDYKQLGLKCVLCAWEVLYNTAAVYCRLGKWQDAERTLEKALTWTLKGQTLRLTTALEQVQDRLFLEPRSIPQGEFFTPRKEDVEELEAKDFLGQPKVIASAFEEDNASSFQDLQPQAIHSGIPLPPEKVPPSWPTERQRMQPQEPMERNVGINGTDPKAALQSLPSSMQAPSAQEEASPTNGRPIRLTVHGTYTANTQMSSVPALVDLHAMLKEECCRQAEEMTLRYKPPGSNELIPISNNEELRKVWQELQSGHLTLWCQGKDNFTDRRVLYQMVARHPYSAQGLEDLNFVEGDILEILSEVNEEWLEGRCNGTVGIFPKCFAVRESAAAAAAAALPPAPSPGTVTSLSTD